MSKSQHNAAQPSQGQGGAEHESERTFNVRERTRAGANAGIGRIGGVR
jgi:hypothetical protein